MKKFVLCIAGVLALVGCGDDGGGRTTMDSGITLMDTGTAMDSTTPPPGDSGTPPPADSSMPPADTGTPPGDCNISMTGQLSGAGCFPRCTAATGMAAQACMDNTCLQTALDADMTPAISVSAGGMPLEVDCALCYSLGVNSCAAELCPTEFNAFAMCSQAMTSDCATEVDAVNACIMGMMDSFQSCAGPRITPCFSTT